MRKDRRESENNKKAIIQIDREVREYRGMRDKEEFSRLKEREKIVIGKEVMSQCSFMSTCSSACPGIAIEARAGRRRSGKIILKQLRGAYLATGKKSHLKF